MLKLRQHSRAGAAAGGIAIGLLALGGLAFHAARYMPLFPTMR